MPIVINSCYNKLALFAKKGFVQRFVQFLGLARSQAHNLGKPLLAGINKILQIAKDLQNRDGVRFIHWFNVGQSCHKLQSMKPIEITLKTEHHTHLLMRIGLNALHNQIRRTLLELLICFYDFACLLGVPGEHHR